LMEYTGGVESVDVDAASAPRVQELLEVLAVRFPGLAGPLEEMAVAIDGEIYQSPGYQPLGPDSEVHLIPRIAGG
jgi:molybdopterin converting factor small subunit